MKEETKKREEEAANSGFFSRAKRISQKLTKTLSMESGLSADANKSGGYQLSDLRHVGLLGSGTFSFVKLVHHLPSNMAYALKVINKQNVVNMHAVSYANTEVEFLREFDHQFIPMIYGTFQDTNFLYVLMELLPNGDLWDILYNPKHQSRKVLSPSPLGGLELSQVVFYSSNVLSALCYMHNKDVIYRDLKPENLVVS
jgi:serine/threonine protein kinase